MEIKKLEDQLLSVKKKLFLYQTGKITPVRTGREWMDSVFGGLLPGDIVTIAGSSGGGKSTELRELQHYVMNVENNPNAANYVWLNNSLEMRLISNVIRDLSKKLKISKKKVLTESPEGELLDGFKKYFDEMSEQRFYINEKSGTPEEFDAKVRTFLEQHKDKEAVFVDVDHIALQKGSSSDKKNSIDDTINILKEITQDYHNVYFIVLSQLNRNLLGRIREKDNNSAPNRGDLYQSDTIYHISDYVYVTHFPQKLGIANYMKVNRDIYKYLASHFSEVKGNKASFNTHSRIFYHVLKAREEDALFKDIFIKKLDFEGSVNFESLENESKNDDLDDMPPDLGPTPGMTDAIKNAVWDKDTPKIDLNDDF